MASVGRAPVRRAVGRDGPTDPDAEAPDLGASRRREDRGRSYPCEPGIANSWLLPIGFGNGRSTCRNATVAQPTLRAEPPNAGCAPLVPYLTKLPAGPARLMTPANADHGIVTLTTPSAHGAMVS